MKGIILMQSCMFECVVLKIPSTCMIIMPMHIQIFANLDMQDESQDFYKTQQLRELAMLNSNFREESPQLSSSISPFSSSGMKRAKTGRQRFIQFSLLFCFSRTESKIFLLINGLVLSQFCIAAKRALLMFLKSEDWDNFLNL